MSICQCIMYHVWSRVMIRKFSEIQQVLIQTLSPRRLITVLCHSWLDASVGSEGMGVKLLIKVWKFSSQQRKQEAINLFQFHLKPPLPTCGAQLRV